MAFGRLTFGPFMKGTDSLMNGPRRQRTVVIAVCSKVTNQ